MQNKYFNTSLYVLLLLPFISAILALLHFGFIFKSGVAFWCIFILVLLYFKRLKQYNDVWMIIIAFLFSICGDWFLSNKHGDNGMFITGIILYFFAHVSYLSYALMNGRIHKSATIALLGGYIFFFFLVLYPSVDNTGLMISVLVYMLISCFSLGAAIGINAEPLVKWTFISGIFLILFSDTIIALKEFVKFRELNFLILPTYYLAQICITFALMRKKEVFHLQEDDIN